MKYTLFEKMGLGNADLSIIILILFILTIVLLGLTVTLIVKVSNLTGKYGRFMSGKSAKSLEREIFDLFEDNKEMKEQISDIKRDIRSIYRQLRTVYQKCSIVRYDAFQEMGGKLSFCLCMLNQDNNGYILNSVHSSSGGCYSYLKEIKEGRCAIDLGNEEQQALDEALKNEVAE